VGNTKPTHDTLLRMLDLTTTPGYWHSVSTEVLAQGSRLLLHKAPPKTILMHSSLCHIHWQPLETRTQHCVAGLQTAM
jgi:hypothetical protein